MTERAKAFFINGGAGRVICSIPALEKYAEETSKNFIIVCEGGTDFYKGHQFSTSVRMTIGTKTCLKTS